MAPETVAVAINRPFDKPLTYSVPPELAPEMKPGVLVEVPLARGREIGAVVALDPRAEEGRTFRLRPVMRRVSPRYRLTREVMDLARWLADYYFCGIGEALATASTIGFSDQDIGEKSVYTLSAGWEDCRLTARQRAAAAALAACPASEALPMADVARAAGASTAVVKKLAEAGALVETSTLFSAVTPPPPADVAPELLPEQQEAFDAVEEARREGTFRVHLLYGITGSGKTEVYLRLMQRALDDGQTALCLVPEISLTPQTVDRFARRFQQEIGVFHSQMTRREKLVLHEKIQRGMVRLVIGARSAVFAPLPRLGLIVIDEEHEGSYKQSETPRYHARDVAIMRASRLRIPVLLGSATPSMESYENAQRGKYRMLRLEARPAGLQLPEVRIAAMGKAAVEEPSGISLLSNELRDAIALRLERGEQTLLFLNRRGFSNFLMCPSCKWVARCSDDDIVLTIHRRRPGSIRSGDSGDEPELDLFPRALDAGDAFVKCHFCGKSHDYPTVCPECGETDLLAVGSGTQRIEECLHRVFPEARLLRLDQDAITGRRKFEAAWNQMISGEAQIILGTQMIAKGLHLEQVTLVGVILAEVGLFIPDFRAEERTFSLLTQVAGRAGRINMGEVILQTYMPHHPSIRLASKHDYVQFFEVEMQRRRKMDFPPLKRLTALTLSDTEKERASGQARLLATILRRLQHRVSASAAVRVLGPRPAPIERIAGRFRQRLLLRAADWKASARLLRTALSDREWRPPSSINLTIDVDPQDLL